MSKLIINECGSRTLKLVSEDNETIQCLCTVCYKNVTIKKERYSKKELNKLRGSLKTNG